MSSPYSNNRHHGLSYANVAAGTLARGNRSWTPLSQASNTATYAHLPHPANEYNRFYMARQERRHSERAELDGHPVDLDYTTSKSAMSGLPSLRSEDTSRCPLHADHPSFFTPSYLARSRHVHRLRTHWEDHILALEDRTMETELARKANTTTITTTTTAVSGTRHRSPQPPPHMYRGVAQRVLERAVVVSAADSPNKPLPTRWNETDKASSLEVLGDGTEVRFAGVQATSPDEAASIRTDHPVPKDIGLYYYEVTILSRGRNPQIGVGFVVKKTNLARLPGWESDTFAYHGDDGDVFSGSSNGRSYGPHFSAHDVIGCGVNFRTNTVFFTKNGNLLGTAFPDVKTGQLYPCVGLKKPSEHLHVNFGRRPFVFDIDSMMKQEREVVMRSVTREDVSKLHPPDDEEHLIQNLISQYLAHEGYVETSKAFQHDLNERERLAPSTASSSTTKPDSDDDLHALNRQRIRRAILDGDIDRALKYTQSYYPLVLQQERNKPIYFRLRCRKFIEMMRRYADLSKATALKGSNRNQDTAVEAEVRHIPDTQMELDEQLQRDASKDMHQSLPGDVDMESSNESHTRSNSESDLLRAAIEYGQGLRAEFDSDTGAFLRQELNDVFALMAYQDPWTSPVSDLLKTSGRSDIAEELNGAILVSLGKPPSAALEKLCEDTETFLAQVSGKVGGAAAFINVKQDFLTL